MVGSLGGAYVTYNTGTLKGAYIASVRADKEASMKPIRGS